jgi:hypothetical protein
VDPEALVVLAVEKLQDPLFEVRMEIMAILERTAEMDLFKQIRIGRD